ncbi:hypothetical protein ECP030230813_3302 [Escherichia coli P0302308.13]|nr:hypothetical protein ECP030230813_3302 [Escherichia coli P0302308.13]
MWFYIFCHREYVINSSLINAKIRMNIAPEQGMAMFCEIHCAYHNCG